MYLFENPVLQRELLVNLRMGRAFLLLFCYQALLALVIFFAWPLEAQDLSSDEAKGRQLVDMLFLGQFLLASLMAPSFAAGTITGEKERKTYEMLLASPLRPAAIVLGKVVASLTHLVVLIVSSLPIVMLCVPLGGVSLYELLAIYLGLVTAVTTFGMISVTCSSFFKRTLASLSVSYLFILPLAIGGVLLWLGLGPQGFITELLSLEQDGQFRLSLMITVVPITGVAIWITLFFITAARLLHPPDVGSEGKEVVDLEQEAQTAVGLVIQPNQFPDRLFAPAKRKDLMEDGANPVYDKEIRSEIFSQGTLMLRLVIQISMLLAIPLMAVCLYILPEYAPWYIAYVIMFNMLVGPVFSAGSVTSERERETLDLLLTTAVSPWQILWGKLVAGLRVSSVLTLFLLWPVLLACVLVSRYWTNLPAVAAYLAIVLATCVTTATVALFWSVVMHKTSISLMATYVSIVLLFCAPLAAVFFTTQITPDVYPQETIARMRELSAEGKDAAQIAAALREEGVKTSENDTRWTRNRVISAMMRARGNDLVPYTGAVSPFSAAFETPLWIVQENQDPGDVQPKGSWLIVAGHLAFSLLFSAALLGAMIWLFNRRWRVSGSGVF